MNDTSEDEPEVSKGSEIFYLPYYGNIRSKYIRYIGIKFAEIDSPFRNFKYTYGNNFQITDILPPKRIVNKMKKLYPNQSLNCRAFLQNNYTSHYYSGFVAAGYKINLIDDEDVDRIEDILNTNNLEVDYVLISHEIKNCGYFIGKQLSEDFKTFDFKEEYEEQDEPGYNLYKLLTTNFEYSEPLILDFKDKVIKSNQIIAFIPTMCSCCT